MRDDCHCYTYVSVRKKRTFGVSATSERRASSASTAFIKYYTDCSYFYEARCIQPMNQTAAE